MKTVPGAGDYKTGWAENKNPGNRPENRCSPLPGLIDDAKEVRVGNPSEETYVTRPLSYYFSVSMPSKKFT